MLQYIEKFNNLMGFKNLIIYLKLYVLKKMLDFIP
jgi:hypothetical protein